MCERACDGEAEAETFGPGSSMGVEAVEGQKLVSSLIWSEAVDQLVGNHRAGRSSPASGRRTVGRRALTAFYDLGTSCAQLRVPRRRDAGHLDHDQGLYRGRRKGLTLQMRYAH